MMRDKIDFSALEPDIVALVLQKVIEMSPGFSQALARQIEQDIKEQHGGQRLFVPKGAKRLTPEQRKSVFQDGLTQLSDHEIVEKHQISKTTLWRIMKSGGGRFSG